MQLELDFSRPAPLAQDARLFMGWDRPALHVAAEHLLLLAPPHDRVIDLQGVLVAVPSARAGRRLLVRLAEAAEAKQRGLLPPRIVTVGALPEALYAPALPLAGVEERLLAWLHALEASPSALLILSAQPSLTLARVAARLQSTLAAERRVFKDAARVAREMDGVRMAERFDAWQSVYERYLARLAEMGRTDTFIAREAALAGKGVRCERALVIVGAPDISGQTVAMLEALPGQTTALVFAPEALAGRFDAFGRVRIDPWIDARIDIPDAQLRFVETAREQGSAARDFIASCGDSFALDDVAVGILDEEVTAPVAEALLQDGVPTHAAAPRPFTESALARLLGTTAAVLGGREIDAFCAWVRHPDVSAALSLSGRELQALDQYRFVHMPRRFAPPFLRLASARDAAGLADSDQRIAPILEALHERVSFLLEPYERAADGDLAAWARATIAFLGRVYAGRKLVREHPDDGMLLDALDAVLLHAERLQTILSAKMSGADALAMTLTFLEDEDVSKASTEPAIELLGWLELLLDDAPCLLLLGLNEGLVPEAQNADAFLPNALKERLGLAGNARRHARDAYVLASLVASRQALFCTVGRRSLIGDPRLPSRLLFATEPRTQAARLKRFIAETAPEEEAVRAVSKALDVPEPKAPFPPLTKLRVTAFADYLACPYRFYLGHILRLDEVSDAGAGEIDARTFGSLTHTILQAFGTSEVKDARDAKPIAEWLNAALDRAFSISYGTPAPPTVLLQQEQLRVRLAAFARWQARWRQQGFAIAHAELALDDVPFLVDGVPLLLRGRIDRVDRHERDGRLVVLDYKTGDSVTPPEQKHRDGERWLDLQLPLYRYALLEQMKQQGESVSGIALGYLPLSAERAPIEAQLVAWGPEVWQSAEECARDIVRQIRAGVFWPMTRPAPRGFDRFSVICQDTQLVDLEDA